MAVSRKMAEIARDATLGMTDTQVMERTGLSYATWRRILQGQVPTDRHLIQMAAGLEIDVEPLLNAAHEVRPAADITDVMGAVLTMAPLSQASRLEIMRLFRKRLEADHAGNEKAA